MQSSEKMIFDKYSEYPSEGDEQCCANYNRFYLSSSLISWSFWSLYGKSNRHSCKIRWTVDRSIPNRADAARILSEELFWNSCLTCSIIPSLVEGLPDSPLWARFPDSIKFSSHLRISVRYGGDFCMTRRTHLWVSVTDVVRWYSERIRAFLDLWTTLLNFRYWDKALMLKERREEYYYQDKAYSLLYNLWKCFKFLSTSCHFIDKKFSLSFAKMMKIARFRIF